MKTIFSTLLQNALVVKLQDLEQLILQAENSIINTTLSFFSIGRDAELSEKKKQEICALKSCIQSFTESSAEARYVFIKDADYAELIIQLLHEALISLGEIRTQHGNHAPGKTEAYIIRLCTFTRVFYAKMETLGVLDVVSDKDPLTIFKSSLSKYVFKNIVDEYFPNKKSDLKRAKALSSRKEALIFHDDSPLAQCSKQLALLSSSLFDLEERQCLVVKDSMLNLQFKNLQLDNDGVVSEEEYDEARIFDGGGELGACLREGIEKINENLLILHSVDEIVCDDNLEVCVIYSFDESKSDITNEDFLEPLFKTSFS